MSYSELEHFSNMVSGCESLTRGNPKEPNAVYALAVLKLHAGDAGHISGTESFLDNVKTAANNTKEWILKLLKSIRDFFFGNNRSKVKKLADSTEATAKLIEKDNVEAIIPTNIPDIVKVNKEVTGSSKWGDSVMKDYNTLPAEDKKEAEEKIKKVIAEQNLNDLGKDVVEALKAKLNSRLPKLQSLGTTINDFGKDSTKAFGKDDDGLTLELNGMSRDAEKELVDGIADAIKNLKVSNLSSTIKWFMTIADSYTKDLDKIVTKSKQMAEKTDDSVALGKINIVTTAYANLIKGYQDLVIISNYALTKSIATTQDKIIKSILTKAAANTRPAADQYSGVSPEASISDFYSK